MGNCCGGEEDNKQMTIGDKKRTAGKGAGNDVGAGPPQELDQEGDIYDYCNSKVKSIFNDLD